MSRRPNPVTLLREARRWEAEARRWDMIGATSPVGPDLVHVIGQADRCRAQAAAWEQVARATRGLLAWAWWRLWHREGLPARCHPDGGS